METEELVYNAMCKAFKLGQRNHELASSKDFTWEKSDTTRWFELFCYFWVACCLGVLAYYRPDVVVVILFSAITLASILVIFFKVGMYFVSRIDSKRQQLPR